MEDGDQKDPCFCNLSPGAKRTGAMQGQLAKRAKPHYCKERAHFGYCHFKGRKLQRESTCVRAQRQTAAAESGITIMHSPEYPSMPSLCPASFSLHLQGLLGLAVLVQVHDGYWYKSVLRASFHCILGHPSPISRMNPQVCHLDDVVCPVNGQCIKHWLAWCPLTLH